MSVLRGMQRGVFTAYPRRIAAAEAEILDVALKLRVRIVAIVWLGLVIGSANIPSMMRPDMRDTDPGIGFKPLMLSDPDAPLSFAKAGAAMMVARTSTALSVFSS